MLKHARQRGMTLIELMIAMTVGLIVVGAVLSVYLLTLESSNATLKSGRLNQELAAIMNIMANDIRRAGYANANANGVNPPAPDWDDPDNTNANDLDNFKAPHTNPFNQRGSTALEVHTYDGATDTDAGETGAGDCIVYAYDRNNNGALNDNESLGFRLNAAGDAIQMRGGITSGSGHVTNSCAQGDWQTLSDERSIDITTLQFDLDGSSCINTLEPDTLDNDGANGVDDWAERDCYTNNPATDATLRATYPTDAPVPLVEVRHVLITLAAKLKSDPDVTAKMRQQVVVRNNLARLIP